MEDKYLERYLLYVERAVLEARLTQVKSEIAFVERTNRYFEPADQQIFRKFENFIRKGNLEDGNKQDDLPRDAHER